MRITCTGIAGVCAKLQANHRHGADTTGGVLIGASVTVTNTQTGFTRTDQANSAGIYVFPNLFPGVYTVRVEMDGFRSAARSEVELQVQQTARLDFSLEAS